MKNFLKKNIMTIIGLAFLLFGGVIVGYTALSRGNMFGHSQPAAPATSFPRNYSPAPTVVQGNPVDLQIPSLGINLPIVNGYYNFQTKQWTLTLDKVQYATMTPPPNNDSGNTFIYGHYRKSVFADLHNIKDGAEAMVKTDNGHVFYYKLAGSRVTTPDDSSLFYYKGKPILTIQTCTGLFFQNRQLFTFNFERVV
jgi:LPXTG-site transpeptidase (sortase) family protein